MSRLTDKDIEKIVGLLQQGKPVPEIYKSKLFSSGDKEYVELTKEYQLVYKGKKRKEDIISDTPEAPHGALIQKTLMAVGGGTCLYSAIT